jgi:hypothetical protein
MAGPRNNSVYFTGSKLLDLSGADVVLDGCIGLYVETGGFVRFDNYSTETGWVTDEFKVADGSYIPGMIRKVYVTALRGTIADGIHALK